MVMGFARMTLAAVGLAGCLALAGCANCFDTEQRLLGFLAPSLHHHQPRRPTAAEHVSAPRPVPVVAPETPLSKCNQQLYLKSSGSPEEMHFLEARCRELILSQPY